MRRILVMLLSCALHALSMQPGKASKAPPTKRQTPKQPNILFVLADDLGFADLDWKDRSLHTPNLRRHAFGPGTAHLTSSYVTPLCTSTRSSLMTGYYPFRTGTQNGVFLQMEASGVPLDFPFLPQNLRQVGYKNYLIGKWHLGYCKAAFLPTNRGFDYFYGYYNAQEGYFNHSSALWDSNLHRVVSGLDLFTEVAGRSVPDRSQNGVYSTHLYTAQAIRVLQNHDRSSPFFLFFSHQSVHAPLQVPRQYRRHCNPLLMDKARQIYCGMLAAMDESFGQMVRFLKQSGLYEDTIIIFSSDNGGDYKAGASNWPLKGQKSTVWEGGTKTTTFIHAPKFIAHSSPVNSLFHVVDWHATILGMARVPLNKYGDGLNQWEAISTGMPSRVQRMQLVYNINPPMSALRHGKYKLVYAHGAVILKDPRKAKLFDLSVDPLERVNLARRQPKLVHKLIDRLIQYQRAARPSVRTPLDERGNPRRFHGTFASGWCR